MLTCIYASQGSCICFHVFTCRILGERFATLPPSHRSTHRGALGLRGAPPGPRPCTTFGPMQDRAWQTGRTGDREADKRHFCNIPFVASPQVVSYPGIAYFNRGKGGTDPGDENRVGEPVSHRQETNLARPRHAEKETPRGYSSPTPSQLAMSPQRPGEFLTPQSRCAGQGIVRRTGGVLRSLPSPCQSPPLVLQGSLTGLP